MATAIILIQLALVLALIFIGARVGGIGLGNLWYGGRFHPCLCLRTEARKSAY